MSTETPEPHGQSWQGPASQADIAMPIRPRKGVPGWVWALVGCGGFGCLVVPVLLAAILFPVFAKAREKARSTICLSNEKQLAIGLMMYTQDYDGKLPPAATWADATHPYVKSERVFKCPAGKTPYGYAFNNAVSHKLQQKITTPENVPMLYDSTAGMRNANDAVTSLPKPGRHDRKNNIAFADGHAHTVADDGSDTPDIIGN